MAVKIKDTLIIQPYLIDLLCMQKNILNDKALNVFIIIAETLKGWKDPFSEEGKSILMEHYAWAKEVKEKGKLLVAGPTDFELTSKGLVNPIGHTTGLIMLKVDTREEAEEWAFKDPFHVHGFRKNAVHSLKITMTDNLLFSALSNQIL